MADKGFITMICTLSLQLETYWNYELCHGQHVRQFHESKTQGTVSTLLVYSVVTVRCCDSTML